MSSSTRAQEPPRYYFARARSHSTLTRAVLTIRLAKHSDGGATLTCVRADGSTTWQRQSGVTAAFFPRHDLTHFAVETVLGYRRGFYGLVADGWDLGDFGAPWPRGPLPTDMDPAELLVGYLDAERASIHGGAQELTAAELSAQVTDFYRARALGAPPPAVTDEQLAAIRVRMAELFARWDALPTGEVLELRFAARP